MSSLQIFLDAQVERYNQVDFITNDPVAIPHGFQQLQDIEIMAFWTAILAWGQRKTIINSALRLVELMDSAPYDFVLNHTEKDRALFTGFKHRTFQEIDAHFFLERLQGHYSSHHSLETAFSMGIHKDDATVENGLRHFHNYFFEWPDAPQRTRKHIATPARKSSCKRLNMFLRWMVRSDDCGVDFGLWEQIRPDQLVMPLDVHVMRVAQQLGLLKSDKTDWNTAVELTQILKTFDTNDPVKYDFALFGMGVNPETNW